VLRLCHYVRIRRYLQQWQFAAVNVVDLWRCGLSWSVNQFASQVNELPNSNVCLLLAAVSSSAQCWTQVGVIAGDTEADLMLSTVSLCWQTLSRFSTCTLAASHTQHHHHHYHLFIIIIASALETRTHCYYKGCSFYFYSTFTPKISARFSSVETSGVDLKLLIHCAEWSQFSTVWPHRRFTVVKYFSQQPPIRYSSKLFIAVSLQARDAMTSFTAETFAAVQAMMCGFLSGPGIPASPMQSTLYLKL